MFPVTRDVTAGSGHVTNFRDILITHSAEDSSKITNQIMSF